MSSRKDPYLDLGSDPPRREPPLLDEHVPPGGAAPAGEGGGPPALEATGLDDDALLHSLVFLTRHHGKERSPQSLLDGIPVDGVIGPDQAVRVMRMAGYNAGLIQRRIGDVHALLLPAVLLLRNGDACVLVKRLETV